MSSGGRPPPFAPGAGRGTRPAPPQSRRPSSATGSPASPGGPPRPPQLRPPGPGPALPVARPCAPADRLRPSSGPLPTAPWGRARMSAATPAAPRRPGPRPGGTGGGARAGRAGVPGLWTSPEPCPTCWGACAPSRRPQTGSPTPARTVVEFVTRVSTTNWWEVAWEAVHPHHHPAPASGRPPPAPGRRPAPGQLLQLHHPDAPAVSFRSPHVHDLWQRVRLLTNAGVAVVALGGGFNVILNRRLGTPYHGASEFFPRLLVGPPWPTPV